MTLGTFTSVLAPTGAIYGIYYGMKHDKGFWQTAGMALLFSFAGAAAGGVIDTLTSSSTSTSATPAASTSTTASFAGASPLQAGMVLEGGHGTTLGNGFYTKGSLNASGDTQPDWNVALGVRKSASPTVSHYMGSTVALRNK